MRLPSERQANTRLALSVAAYAPILYGLYRFAPFVIEPVSRIALVGSIGTALYSFSVFAPVPRHVERNGMVFSRSLFWLALAAFVLSVDNPAYATTRAALMIGVLAVTYLAGGKMKRAAWA
jgi:hypothetical protein